MSAFASQFQETVRKHKEPDKRGRQIRVYTVRSGLSTGPSDVELVPAKSGKEASSRILARDGSVKEVRPPPRGLIPNRR